MSELNKHWLLRKKNIRKLWMVFILILLLTVLADLFVHHHESFGIEDSFGFFAWYGFITCVGMVIFAKFLGLFLKRPQDYYETESNKSTNNVSKNYEASHD